jgi:hypothetical protein
MSFIVSFDRLDTGRKERIQCDALAADRGILSVRRAWQWSHYGVLDSTIEVETISERSERNGKTKHSD